MTKEFLRTSYSNSQNENDFLSSIIDDEKAVKEMYETSPYPDLGHELKNIDLYLIHIIEDLKKRSKVSFLDVGCGTGHIVAGIAKKHPNWDCYGTDLSRASLDIADKLFKKHKLTNVTTFRQSYLEKLPFQEKSFDVVSAMGTIHHTGDPLAAMINLKKYIKDDGYMLLHLYGWRCDHKKFDIKEMLTIFEPNLNNYTKRFEFYDALIKHRKGRWVKRLANISLIDIYVVIKTWWHNFKRRMNKISWSPGWDANYPEINSPWVDHFCHPCERAYQVTEVKELVEKSGFSVLKMLKQGKLNPRLMPPLWKKYYNGLDQWDQWRLNELLAEGGGSFALILKKI